MVRVLRAIGFALFVVFVFTLALAASLLVHVRLRVAREAITDQVNRALASSLAGKVRIDGVEWVGFLGARVRSVVAHDPDGVFVLRAAHVDIKVSARALPLLFGNRIVIERVRVGDGEVLLDDSSRGLRVARAFASKRPSKEPSTLDLTIRQAAIDHAWVHGDVVQPPLDIDLARVEGTLAVRNEEVGIDVDGAELAARNVLGRTDVHGAVAGRLDVRHGLHFVASFSGHGGGIPLLAVGRLDGEAFSIRARVPEASASSIKELVPSAPVHENVSADARAEGTVRAFSFEGTARMGRLILVGGGHYEDEGVHAVARATHVDLRAFDSTIGQTDARAEAVLDFRRGVGSLRGRFDPRGGHASVVAHLDEQAIDAEVLANVRDARAVLAPFVGNTQIAGHGELRARAHFAREIETIQATAMAQLEDVSDGSVSAGHVRIQAHAAGPMADPTLGVEIQADRPSVPKMYVGAAHVNVNGRLRDARVTARIAAKGPFDLDAHVTVDPKGTIVVHNFTATYNGKRALRGSFQWDHGRGEAHLIGHGIDLGQVHNMFDLEMPLSGTLGVEVDARFVGKSLDGRIALSGKALEIGKTRELDALVDVSCLSGGACSVMVHARTPRAGWISIESSDLQIAGPSLEPASWARATGSLRVAATINLKAVGELRSTPSSMQGFGSVTLFARRKTRRGPPEVSIAVKATDLEIMSRPYKLGLDARARVDASGAASVHVDIAHAHERATLDATSKLDWDVLRGRRAPDLEKVPFTFDLSAPAVDLGPICDGLREPCKGSAMIAAHAEGPFERVHGNLTVRLSSFGSILSPLTEKSDASLTSSFDRQSVKANVAVARAGSEARELGAHLDVRIPENPIEWYGSIESELRDLPLRVAPTTFGQPVTARMSGTASVHDLHRDARARVDLRAANLDVGGVHTDSATIQGEYDGHTLSLATHVSAQGSTLDAHAETNATWGVALAPTLDSTAPLNFGVRAANFRLRTLAPLLPPSAGGIDGRLDADATGTLLPRPTRLTVVGWAKLAQGTIESSSFGQLQDVEGRVDARADGTIELSDAHFRGSRGLVKLHARARTTGGTLQDVEANATIDRSDPFSLIVGGRRIGDVWGHIDAKAHNQGHAIAARVDVPTLHVTLPEQEYRTLQELGPAADIAVGVRRRDGALVPIAVAAPSASRGVRAPMPVTIEIALGKDVEVRRGEMLDVTLAGHPVVKIGATTQAYGTIRLVRGTIEVEGRRFQIEHGTVTFDGPPANPTLQVSAGWDAPDRTHVVAEYVGRADKGKLTLSSDPPHTRDEIIALLVYGSSGGPSASAEGGAVAAAGALGGATATRPLNKVLEQLTHGTAVRTKIETTGPTARAAVEVQIAERIWAQVAYVIGLPPPGTQPDRAFLTLAWRVTAQWSLNFTIGDRGSTIFDVLWEKRY